MSKKNISTIRLAVEFLVKIFLCMIVLGLGVRFTELLISGKVSPNIEYIILNLASFLVLIFSVKFSAQSTFGGKEVQKNKFKKIITGLAFIITFWIILDFNNEKLRIEQNIEMTKTSVFNSIIYEDEIAKEKRKYLNKKIALDIIGAVIFLGSSVYFIRKEIE